MSRFSRDELCHTAPERHDALLPSEKRILELWDSGKSVAEIAALLGMSEVAARKVVRVFDDRDSDDHEALMRRGSEMLRARILQFHPHVSFGGER